LPLHTLETCPEIDICVLGEGEETIVDLADCIARGGDFEQIKGLAIRRDGVPVRTPPRARLKGVDAIPQPAWDLTPIANYLDNGMGYGIDMGRSMPALATRGCPYQCTFCSSPTMWTTRWVARDPAQVLDEIQEYIERYGATNIDFYDLTAIVKREWILNFCDLIEKRGMKFTWQIPSGTRSEALDAEVCHALYRAGCRYVSYAPESGSPPVLERIKKRVKLDRMMVSMRAAVREGMHTKANMIIGFPDETRREVWETIGFLARMACAGVHDIGYSTFSPYPGSELFDDLRVRGKLPELDENYFLSLVSQTDIGVNVSRCDNLSSRELSVLRVVGYMTFYGVQYAVRPWRLFRTIFNFVTKRQESRLDKLLIEFSQRRSAVRRASAAGSPASGELEYGSGPVRPLGERSRSDARSEFGRAGALP